MKRALGPAWLSVELGTRRSLAPREAWLLAKPGVQPRLGAKRSLALQRSFTRNEVLPSHRDASRRRSRNWPIWLVRAVLDCAWRGVRQTVFERSASNACAPRCLRLGHRAQRGFNNAVLCESLGFCCRRRRIQGADGISRCSAGARCVEVFACDSALGSGARGTRIESDGRGLCAAGDDRTRAAGFQTRRTGGVAPCGNGIRVRQLPAWRRG